MSEPQLTVRQEVKDVMEQIIAENHFNIDANVTYKSGSELGDGYSSQTFSACIEDGKSKPLNLFIKTTLGDEPQKSEETKFTNEIFFYTDVYPGFQKFLRERGVEDGFRNVAKCYGIGEVKGKEVLALEDLRYKNYTLLDRTKPINDLHMYFILKTYAKFHAISYAMRDQKTKEFDKLALVVTDFLIDRKQSIGEFDIFLKKLINKFVAKLDPVKDKRILDRCDNLAENLVSCFLKDAKYLSKYAVISQGDCWLNNMMFNYDHSVPDRPTDMIIVDWQLVRCASPVYDLAHFFYTSATKDMMAKMPCYLKMYHDALSEMITKLGSKPEELYPFSVFTREWAKYGKSGAAIAFVKVQAMTFSKEQASEFTAMLKNANKGDMAKSDMPKAHNEEEVMQRMKDIMEHLIDEELL